jgi:hypothetical protein
MNNRKVAVKMGYQDYAVASAIHNALCTALDVRP